MKKLFSLFLALLSVSFTFAGTERSMLKPFPVPHTSTHAVHPHRAASAVNESIGVNEADVYYLAEWTSAPAGMYALQIWLANSYTYDYMNFIVYSPDPTKIVGTYSASRGNIVTDYCGVYADYDYDYGDYNIYLEGPDEAILDISYVGNGVYHFVGSIKGNYIDYYYYDVFYGDYDADYSGAPAEVATYYASTRTQVSYTLTDDGSTPGPGPGPVVPDPEHPFVEESTSTTTNTFNFRRFSYEQLDDNLLRVTLKPLGSPVKYDLVMDVFVSEFDSAIALPAGTYTFSSDSLVGTILASAGAPEGTHLPTYLRTYTDGVMDHIYFLQQGTLTVTQAAEHQIVLSGTDFTSVNGSVFQFTASATVTIEKPDIEPTALSDIFGNAPATKRIVDGQLLIELNGHLYDLRGTEIR